MKQLIILSLLSVTCAIAFGEEGLYREGRQLQQIFNQCTFFDKLARLAKSYRTLPIADLIFEATAVSDLMQRYRAHHILKTYVSVFRKFVTPNVKLLAGFLVEFHSARPKMVDALAKITFNNAVKNKGLAFMKVSLPFYTHGSEMLKFEEISTFGLGSVLKSGVQLSKMVKKAMKISNSNEKTILSQLSKSILPLTKTAKTGWKAYGRINSGFKKILALIKKAGGSRRRSVRSTSDDCIDCMCKASGCEKYLGKCTNDGGTWRCGPMWISEAVWNECGRPKGDWKSCARDSVSCTKQCVRNYLNKYRTRCTGKPADQITCEEDAKLYMAGPPNGCKSTASWATNYWNSVKECLPVSKPYERESINGLNCAEPQFEPGCPKCGDKGTCGKVLSRRTFCKCNPMYYGELCTSRYTRNDMAECEAWGDVHYVTFDNATLDIQNECEVQLVNGFGIEPHFEVRLLPYKKSPGADVSFTKRITIITRDKTKQTWIEILHKDDKGHHVKVNGVRVTTSQLQEPYVHSVNYFIGGESEPIKHTIGLTTRKSTDFVEVNIEEGAGLIVQYDGNPANGYAYVRLTDNWKGNVNGVCGNFNGNPNDDLRKKSDPIYVNRGNEDNFGLLIGNSWKTSLVCRDTVKDDSIDMDRPWRDLEAGRNNKRRDINKLKLTKLYCQYADCGGETGTHKWESCVADTYYAVSVEQQCHILETSIFAASRCWRTEFNCSAIVEQGQNRK
ncbi:unnamed protein product [Owenia fusiformis]|uniref:lysozyme n=1 Tax=Owenia fusiformis TaxID=6347 RepID=A0A8S4Q900_OWEFU|nr:unnamed protein product [Owenia fusiformis]